MTRVTGGWKERERGRGKGGAKGEVEEARERERETVKAHHDVRAAPHRTYFHTECVLM